jgi:hypothetical protein
MGKYQTKKTLRSLCAKAGIRLYKHKLDGASYQLCAGGYVVNGYTTQEPFHEVVYYMQKQLIHLLKYGSDKDGEDGTSISWHKERTPVPPLSTPINHYILGRVFTCMSLEADAEYQAYLDLQHS